MEGGKQVVWLVPLTQWHSNRRRQGEPGGARRSRSPHSTPCVAAPQTRHERTRTRTRERALLHADQLNEAVSAAGLLATAGAAAAMGAAKEEKKEEKERKEQEAVAAAAEALAGQRSALSWSVWFPLQVRGWGRGGRVWVAVCLGVCTGVCVGQCACVWAGRAARVGLRLAEHRVPAVLRPSPLPPSLAVPPGIRRLLFSFAYGLSCACAPGAAAAGDRRALHFDGPRG